MEGPDGQRRRRDAQTIALRSSLKVKGTNQIATSRSEMTSAKLLYTTTRVVWETRHDDDDDDAEARGRNTQCRLEAKEQIIKVPYNSNAI